MMNFADLLKMNGREVEEGKHWYRTGCACQDCCEVRRTATIPWPVVEKRLGRRNRRRETRG